MTRPVTFHELACLDEAARARLLARTEDDLEVFIDKVRPIISAVKAEGDEALARLARTFEKAPVDAATIAATPADFDEAMRTLDPGVLDSLRFAADSIRIFHEEQKPEEMWMKEVRPGVFAGDRYRPISSVACYVPRGKGAFPSSVLMQAIPASVAGVPTRYILTPPGPDGRIDAATLVAARLAGIEHAYKAGGAQAVAAAAFGTATIPRADKIVGPGSPYLVAAKRLLAGVIDPGTPAGPSETMILADGTLPGALAALDLLIEAEHGADSSAWLVTWDRRTAEEAIAALPGFWAQMSAQRVEYSSAVLCGKHGGVILARDAEDAIRFANDYAPEHLEILSAEPFAYLGRIEHAGEILLGAHTPTTLGNFVLGPNHVLPTSRAARTRSPLSVLDFMKRSSVGYATAAGYTALAPHARRIAEYEGFDAHANAVSAMRSAHLKE
jgi:histidinol dehydrogenase